VQVSDYVNSVAPMPARMFEKTAEGYDAIGYELENATNSGPGLFVGGGGFYPAFRNASSTASGWCAMTASRTRAGPSGLVRPCSQFLRVAG